jgi:AcrR family transcriptional regulator
VQRRRRPGADRDALRRGHRLHPALRRLAELGLTKAAVYYHFRAESDILHATIKPGVERLKALLDEAAAMRGRRARIEHLVDGFVDFLVQHRHYATRAFSDPAAKRNKLDGERNSLAQRALTTILRMLRG